MFCRSCGENIPVDSVFCPNCGKNLLEVESKIARPAAREEEPEPEQRLFRRRRRGMTEAAVPTDDEYEEEGSMPVSSGTYVSVLERLGLQRLFWAMGLMFAVVGFIVGMSGSTRTAIVWILFGLVLLIAAPHAPETRRPDPPEPEEASD